MDPSVAESIPHVEKKRPPHAYTVNLNIHQKNKEEEAHALAKTIVL